MTVYESRPNPAMLKVLHDEAVKLLRERLAPDVVRAKVYALRDRLHLDLPADLIEELLLLASEETGILKDARDGQEIHTGSTWQE